MLTTVGTRGATLGVEHLGDPADPLVLLAGGTTMLAWAATAIPEASAGEVAAAMLALSAPASQPGVVAKVGAFSPARQDGR